MTAGPPELDDQFSSREPSDPAPNSDDPSASSGPAQPPTQHGRNSWKKAIAGLVGLAGAALVFSLKLGLFLGPPAAIGVIYVMTDRENAYVHRVNAALKVEQTAEMQASRNCTSPSTCRASLDTWLTGITELANAAANPPALCACVKWGNDLVVATGYYQRGIKMVEAGFDSGDQATFDAGWKLLHQGDAAIDRANADSDKPAPG